MNRYARWKYIVLFVIVILALIYAVPNLFPDDPSVQISSSVPGKAMTNDDLSQTVSILHRDNLNYLSASIDDQKILIRFSGIDEQSKAKDKLSAALGNQYVVAITLASSTPEWLQSLGALPMRLGLDLRGGVSLLLQVDVDAVVQSREKGDVRSIADLLRKNRVRYTDLSMDKSTVHIEFQNTAARDQAQSLLKTNMNTYTWQTAGTSINGQMTPDAIEKVRQYTIDQTRETIQRRVDALGVSNATVQQAGLNRISVDLPGIQDATLAQSLLGKTATIEFHLVDTEHDPMVAASTGVAPPGTALYQYNGAPILLKDPVILTGDSVTSATSAFDQSGRPAVNIRIGGAGESMFYHVTSQNINKPLAVLYIETKSHPVKQADGKTTIVYKTTKKVINSANIESALGAQFQVMGMESTAAANQLALLLRSGALVAPVTVVASHVIGPSMGKQNVHQGMLSLEVGLILVIVFMALYYSAFGVITDIALVINLVFLVAILSLLGAVLTFPGIAGLVLTLGMAVDANVLIFERVREELRNGVSVQAAIEAGYGKAFATIMDSNITTFIAALVLFSLGTGAIKNFAIVTCIGLVTSVFSQVTYTRAMVNLRYGGKKLSTLPIGIKLKPRKGAND